MYSVADVYAIFERLKESTWIESLDKYGYPQVTVDQIPEIVSTLSESTWAEKLDIYKPDIVADGLQFISVPEMKRILAAT